MSFFTYFTASFSAIILFWVIVLKLETRIPVIALFVDQRYYYLSCIHAQIVSMRYDREKEETILDEIKQLKFPFFVYPSKKSLEHLSYVKELIQRDDLVKRYLFNQKFTYSSFKELVKEFDTPLNSRERAAQMALWDLLPNPSDEQVEKLMTLFVSLLTPAFFGSEDNPRLSPGENELNVFSAAKAAGVIKKDCSPGAFVSCMQQLKLAHSDMQVVKSRQGLLKHSDKDINRFLIEGIEKRFRETIV